MLSRIFLAVVVCSPLMAGEYAMLSSGSRLRADRHEQAGDVIRLFSGEGVVEVPAQSIVGFEEFADPIPEPVPQVAAISIPVIAAPTPMRWDPLESTCRHASLSIL